MMLIGTCWSGGENQAKGESNGRGVGLGGMNMKLIIGNRERIIKSCIKLVDW